MFRLFISIFICTFLSVSLWAQKPPIQGKTDASNPIDILASDVSTPSKNYFDKAYHFFDSARYDSASIYFNKSRQIYYQRGLWNFYIEASGPFIYSLIYLDKIDSASKIMAHDRKIVEQDQVVTDTSALIYLYNLQGMLYYRLKKMDSCVFITEHSLHLVRQFVKDPNSTRLARAYNNLALTYQDYRMLDQALQNFDSAIAIMERRSELQSFIGATLLSNKAEIFLFLGDYEKAMDMRRRSYEIFKEVSPADKLRLARSLVEIGHCYVKRNLNNDDLLEGLRFIDQGMKLMEENDLLSHHYISEIELSYAEAYEKLGKYDVALQHLYQALHKIETLYHHENQLDKALIDQHIASILIKTDQLDKAAKIADTSLTLFAQNVSDSYKQITKSFILKGDIWVKKNRFDSALYDYQTAIGYMIHDFKPNHYFTNPDLSKLYTEELLLEVLLQKADALRLGALQNQETAWFRAALDTYQLIDQFIKLSRKGFYTTYSKLTYIEKNSDFYEDAVRTALLLHQHTHDQAALEAAFKLADSRKFSLLKEGWEEARAKATINMPPSLLDKENKLKAEIAYTQQRLYELNTAAGDTQHIMDRKALEARLFDTKNAFESLTKHIENTYPAYYQLKYDLEELDISQLKETLLPEQILIQYFIGKNHLYVWFLSKEKTDYMALPKDASFEENVSLYVNYLKSQPFKHQENMAYRLYGFLLKPVLDKIEKEKPEVRCLTIIPDGILGYLPFETLIRQAPQAGQGYKDLAYLIKDYEISYHYSASLLSFKRPAQEAGPQNTFIGFAPSFTDDTDQQLLTFNETVRSYMDSAKALPYALEEVNFIATLLHGKAQVGAQATEQNFKAHAGQYKIIHLASHSYINNIDPLYSMLIFDARHDSIEDGLLHTYELYNMQLHADLVCLSACNTGVGKYYKGEGIMSLAQGFMHAGVPNLMMSLWSVADRPTKDMMALFYQELKKGKPYAEALRTAKLQYLAQADNITANPYYWGAFIYVGQTTEDTAIQSGKTWLGIGIGLALLLVMTGTILWRRK